MGKCTVVVLIRDDATCLFWRIFSGHVCGSRSTRQGCKANLRLLSSSSTAADIFSFFSFHNIFLRSYAAFLKATVSVFLSLPPQSLPCILASPSPVRQSRVPSVVSTSTRVSMANNARVSSPSCFFELPTYPSPQATDSNPHWRSQGKWRRERCQQTPPSNIRRHRRWCFARNSPPQRAQGRSTTSCPQ